MKVDFPRWEEGDPISWASRAELYFRFHRTTDASMVEIAAIHLEGDAIQWFDWFEHTMEPEIREVKVRQPYTLMAVISFVRLQEE
ncbi:hypothetical protein BHE74_00031381 [Ensete ventricosum]|uniref:Retrotransposon gag domain-containing protein n=1 Tax=Ensete ventricosum TaxID=4639 RepID=A0A427A8G9_ENSVE|nr:hypothetical protein B296_00012269 [Ensete ventricosum]RWW61553.1 hypothetical protein BHE74_00031381 [Ensete ventricosum]RZR70906.1 hypothetical protein BHM03_00002149 [Ensete ventricosum]